MAILLKYNGIGGGVGIEGTFVATAVSVMVAVVFGSVGVSLAWEGWGVGLQPTADKISIALMERLVLFLARKFSISLVFVTV